MDKLRESYIDYHFERCEEELKNCIDVLCDLSIEPDIRDFIRLFQAILDLRGLKSFIERER